MVEKGPKGFEIDDLCALMTLGFDTFHWYKYGNTSSHILPEMTQHADIT
jgi:hypothetical protein